MAASPSRLFTLVGGLLAGSCRQQDAADALTPAAAHPRVFELANRDTTVEPQFRDLPSPPHTPPPPAQHPPPPPPAGEPPPRESSTAPPEIETVVPAAPDTGTVAVVVTETPGARPVFLITSTPRPFADNPPPRYPEPLEGAGIPGKVLVRFVIDTAGRVEMGTLTVLGSTHPLFTDAVRTALSRWRFYAAEVSGRKVRQIVQVPILFSLPR